MYILKGFNMSEQANDQAKLDEAAAAEAAAAEAAAAEPTDKAATKTVKKGAAKKQSYRAVFGGPMVNPLTEDRFTGEPSKLVLADAWIDLQVNEGKLEVVED